MSEAELNLAIHQEVEGWEWVQRPGGVWYWQQGALLDGKSLCPNYANDPAWCVAMMEKCRLRTGWHPHTDEAVIMAPGHSDPVACDKTLTRAVALAVLEITRSKP